MIVPSHVTGSLDFPAFEHAMSPLGWLEHTLRTPAGATAGLGLILLLGASLWTWRIIRRRRTSAWRAWAHLSRRLHLAPRDRLQLERLARALRLDSPLALLLSAGACDRAVACLVVRRPRHAAELRALRRRLHPPKD